MPLDHDKLIGTWGSEPLQNQPRNSRVLRIEKRHVDNHQLIGLEGEITITLCNQTVGPAKYGFVLNERISDSKLRFIANEHSPNQYFTVKCRDEWTLQLGFLDQIPDVIVNIDPEYRFIELNSPPNNYYTGTYRMINRRESLLNKGPEEQSVDDESKQHPAAKIIVNRYDEFLAAFRDFGKD